LLSQVLVAFTIEFDNEFERRMGDAGHPGAFLSMVVWGSLMRFVGETGTPVRELTARCQAADRVKFELGCLERWRFVLLEDAQRDGWGSGRGIRLDHVVRPTQRGRAACEVWPPLFGEIERRWEVRFGQDTIDRLRQALRGVLPHASSDDEYRWLPTLLSRALTSFQVEFDRESPVPLLYCANTLRVLAEQPVRLADLPGLTGLSAETSDIGWQLRPYVVVSPDPEAKQGKVVRLSSRGLKVQRDYVRLVHQIETRWEEIFGSATVDLLRQSLRGLFDGPLSEGMVPQPGTIRAGDPTPALGRRVVAPAARQRMRDMVAQTEAFVRDPAGSLPQYPAWDMNRGFGP
jgi:hypothetical protein